MSQDERLKVHHFMKRECVCKKCLTWTFVHYFIKVVGGKSYTSLLCTIMRQYTIKLKDNIINKI